ncbi:MAG: type IV secretion system DNA-binding domain-containing protein, partial [Candidatus Sulfotelmatobacter sp.]
VWIDMLVLRLLNEPKAHQKRVWFVLDELASLQRLPQFHTALTENRKSNNPLIMGFQGKAQLEVIYGHLAEVMLSMPTTSIFLKTKEPNSGEWVSKAIGKVEIERMKESHFDGTRSGRNFALDIQVEPAVMESEISGLPDLHAFIKYENYVTGFSFPYIDIEGHQIPFERRHLPDEKLTFDPKNIKAKARDGTAAPPPALPAAPRAAVDLEAKLVEETNAAGSSPNNELASLPRSSAIRPTGLFERPTNEFMRRDRIECQTRPSARRKPSPMPRNATSSARRSSTSATSCAMRFAAAWETSPSARYATTSSTATLSANSKQ